MNVNFEDVRHLVSRTGIGAHPTEISRLVGLEFAGMICK